MNKHGNNSYEIRYHYLVVKEDLPKLSKDYKLRIKSAIERKLTTRPDIFGKPLRKSLKGYRKLRVGNYRIVFRAEARVIFILLIEHRSVVYKEIFKRLT